MMPENSIEGRAEPFLQRVESVLNELDSLKGKYMADAKALRGGIKEIYKDAKAEEVNVRALKGLVKYRELERKQNAIADELEDEDADDFETLVEALGDFGGTPLGQAALDLAGDDEGDDRPSFKQTEDQAPKPKRARKPRSPAAEHAQALGGESAEETAALDEIEQAGIGGAAASFTVQQ